MYSATTASYNTIYGWYAGVNMTTGLQNTVIGYRAGDSLTEGHNNVFVGKDAGELMVSGDNNVILGYNAQASSTTVDNEITLGGSGITSLRCADTSISSLSDRRDKTDIVDLPVGLDFLNSLKPRQFKWKTRDGNVKDNRVDAGFIAQELQTAQTGYQYLRLVMDENPDKLEAKQGNLIPLLVKAIQELSAKVTALEAA